MKKSPKRLVADYLATIRRNPTLKFQSPESHISNFLLEAEEEGYSKEEVEKEVGDLYLVIMKALSSPS